MKRKQPYNKSAQRISKDMLKAALELYIHPKLDKHMNEMPELAKFEASEREEKRKAFIHALIEITLTEVYLISKY